MPRLRMPLTGTSGSVLAGTVLLLAQAATQRYLGASMHKNLFPLSGGDVAGLALAAISLFVAAGGGIGGGALLVPILLIAMHFQPNNAVALSNITIVGGSLANFLFNVRRRHPFVEKALVDWDLILVMEPTTILGALVGSYANKLLPAWATTVLLAALLLFLSVKLIKRGVRTFRAETAELKAAAASNGGAADARRRESSAGAEPSPPTIIKRSAIALDRLTTSVSSSEHTTLFETLHDRAAELAEDVLETASELAQPLLGVRVGTRGPAIGSGSGADGEAGQAAGAGDADDLGGLTDEQQARLAAVLKAEGRQLPWQHLATLLLLTAAVVAVDTAKAYVPCGGASYWVIALSLVPLTAAISAIAAAWLTRKYRLKAAAGRRLPKGEVAWTPRNTVLYPAVCSLAGLVAGMFGVGGGIVKGPLMLEMGVLPEVAAATSATMIMFTAASASVVYIGFGTVKTDYGIALFLIGLAVTFGGQAAATMLMQRLQRRSVVIFCMAALMSLAAVVMTAESVARTIVAAKHRQLTEWGSIC